MVESVTASLAAGIILVVVAVIAIARAVKRRTNAREAEPMLQHPEREKTRTRRAS
jgi:hypothetical protein